jgi:spore coat protein F
MELQSGYPNHLAWHETLDLHELVAFQTIGLIKFKRAIGKIKDNDLRSLYEQTITALESNLQELLKFYPSAPRSDMGMNPNLLEIGFYAGDLLAFAKTAVRNYAIAITETATPILREILSTQLQAAIDLHATVFDYMYKKGLYPSYDLTKLLNTDVQKATAALNMTF